MVLLEYQLVAKGSTDKTFDSLELLVDSDTTLAAFADALKAKHGAVVCCCSSDGLHMRPAAFTS